VAVTDTVILAHYEALSVLLRPLIQCTGGGEPIGSTEAYKILRDWDKARNRKINA
jgi:hypothetical protein